jgi:8-oxo-dGTP pyrophosphatase MutT (NUDIX family)
LPAEERSSFERLGFQVEQAFWFYDDFYRVQYPRGLPRLTLRAFGERLLQRHPQLLGSLVRPGTSFDDLYERFMAYKLSIPVCGAIILNPDLTKCLMVKGWSSRASWGFPKGKIGKDEEAAACAVREVFEETGFDIGDCIEQDEFIEAASYGGASAAPVATRLFIITGVSEDTIFQPQTRKEISKIAWHPIAALPLKQHSGPYFNVVQFTRKLRSWIQRHQTRVRPARSIRRAALALKPTSASNPMTQTQTRDGSTRHSDIFERLKRIKAPTPSQAAAPVSLLMRDNPSPVHLFKQAPLPKPRSTMIAAASNPVIFESPSKSLSTGISQHMEAFCLELQRIRVERAVIEEAVARVLLAETEYEE